MIKLLAIKKHVALDIRERFSLNDKKAQMGIAQLNNKFDEIVVLNTCNRTEVYFNSSYEDEEEILKEIFEAFKWEYSLMEQCTLLNEERTIRHLMDVSCGFHSKILGEDQILGQIKNAYIKSIELKSVRSSLKKLFELAISCGKEFRTKSKLYEIPVSSSSIAVNEAIKKGAKKFMILGYGDVGRLVCKYILSNNYESLIIGVRDISKVDDINDSRIISLNYDDAKKEIDNIDCLISCTSAPHIMIEKTHIKPRTKQLIIFDLAVPRDIEEEVAFLDNVELYDIDSVSSIDDINKEKRKNIMNSNLYIIDKYIDKFNEWKMQRRLTPYIIDMKNERDKVVQDRVESFTHKCKDDEHIDVASILIKSAADVYINRAIEVMKEEAVRGSEDECIRILKKIFIEMN